MQSLLSPLHKIPTHISHFVWCCEFLFHEDRPIYIRVPFICCLTYWVLTVIHCICSRGHVSFEDKRTKEHVGFLKHTRDSSSYCIRKHIDSVWTETARSIPWSIDFVRRKDLLATDNWCENLYSTSSRYRCFSTGFLSSEECKHCAGQ